MSAVISWLLVLCQILYSPFVQFETLSLLVFLFCSSETHKQIFSLMLQKSLKSWAIESCKALNMAGFVTIIFGIQTPVKTLVDHHNSMHFHIFACVQIRGCYWPSSSFACPSEYLSACSFCSTIEPDMRDWSLGYGDLNLSQSAAWLQVPLVLSLQAEGFLSCIRLLSFLPNSSFRVDVVYWKYSYFLRVMFDL